MDGFQRDISMKLRLGEGDEIIITSTMADCFHDIVLETVVDSDTMKIKDMQVDFRQSPEPGCPLVQDRLNLLIGTTISRGLTKRLFDALGGPKGCANLRNMLLCSLPIALNFKAGEGIVDSREMLDTIRDKLAGTCIGYAKPVHK